MSKQLGAIDVCCDAPPYRIVRSSRGLGIQRPEDVRWLRMNSFHCAQTTRHRGLSSYMRWFFLGTALSNGQTCTCGETLPELNCVVINLARLGEEEEAAYLLGQCPSCHTVFWDVSEAIE